MRYRGRELKTWRVAIVAVLSAGSTTVYVGGNRYSRPCFHVTKVVYTMRMLQRVRRNSAASSWKKLQNGTSHGR